MKEEITEDTISLKELIEKGKEWYTYLLSKWKLIVLVGLTSGFLGLGYSFTQEAIYKASLSFALEDDGGGSGGLGGALGLASQFGFDFGGSGGGAFEGSNLIELFKSRSIVEKTLLTPVIYNGKEVSLVEMYIQFSKLRKGWKKKRYKNIQFLPNAERKFFTRDHDSILGSIYEKFSKNSLVVSKKDKKIDITTIEVSSENELFAQYFTEALVKEVSDFYIETKSKKAKINMNILMRQTDSIRGELNNAITGVAVANDNTFGLNPAMNVKRTPSARRQVDVQANTAILTELVKQTELAKVSLRKQTPLIQIIDRPILPLVKKQFGWLKGIAFGGFFGGFLCVSFLIIKRVFKKLLL
jgi:hypothetical protein